MPEPTERRWAFAPLPMHCPHCDRRLRQTAVVLHGGVIRCEGCKRLQYIVLLGQIQLCLMADITASELADLSTRGASPREVLEYLGIRVRAA